MPRAKGKERLKQKRVAKGDAAKKGEEKEAADEPEAAVDLKGPYKYRPMRPTDPPFTAADPLSGEQQGLFVWSYVAPGATRQRAEKVGLVVHGCFVKDGPEVDEFVARLHAAWPDFDIYKTSTGRWVSCPLPDDLDRLVPKKYDNADLEKLMEQHRRKEEAIRRANVQRMKEVKKLQKRQVLAQARRAKESNVEPRKILTDEELKQLEDFTTQPNPFENYRLNESEQPQEQQQQVGSGGADSSSQKDLFLLAATSDAKFEHVPDNNTAP